MTMASTSLDKKSSLIVRTFATDLEQARANQVKKPALPAKPQTNTAPIPKIGLRHSSQKKRPTKLVSPVAPIVTTPSPTSSTQTTTITLRTKPTIPKPIIVNPSIQLPPVMTPPPLPRPLNASTDTRISRLAPLTENQTRVKMGDEETDDQATIITDTKHKRFKVGRSVRGALTDWFRNLFRRSTRVPKRVPALPAAAERQGVIKRATTRSGTSATARDTTFAERVQNRPTISNVLPAAVPVINAPAEPHHEVFWTAKTEPGYPLLTAEPLATVTDSTPHIPAVVIAYKQFARPTHPSVSVPNPQVPVVVTPRTMYVAPTPDPEVDSRWEIVRGETDISKNTALHTEASVPRDTTPTTLVPVAETVLPAKPTLPMPAETVESNMGSAPARSTVSPTHETFPSVANVDSQLVSPVFKAELVPVNVIVETPVSSLTTVTEPEMAPTVPAYTKRIKPSQDNPSLSSRLRELVLRGDTNVLTLAIVGVVLSTVVLAVSIWLLVRAFTG